MKRIPFTQFRDRVLFYRLAAPLRDGMGGRQPGTRRLFFFNGKPRGDYIPDMPGGLEAVARALREVDARSLTPCQVHAPHFWDGAVEGRAGGSITTGITVRLTPNLAQWLKTNTAESALRLLQRGETYKVLDADYSRKGYVTYTAVKVKLHGA